MNKYHHGNLRNSIIEASIKIISEKGIEQLSIRSAAKIIGVSHTAPYRHFKNKEELLVAIALKGFEILEKKLNLYFDKESDDLNEIILKIGNEFINFAVNNKNYYRIMFGNYIMDKREYHDFFSAYNSIFQKLTGKILSHTNKKRGRGDASVTAVALFSVLHGYSSLVIDNQEDEHVGQEKQINSILKKITKIVD